MALFASCERSLYVEPEYVIDSKYLMQKDYEVPLQTGKVTVVTMGEDTLAVTDMALTIQVPSDVTVTRAGGNDLDVSYVDYTALPQFTTGSYITASVGTYLFEDSRDADYDYNDAILHVKHLVSGSTNGKRNFQFKVRGVALGSSKQIGFGFTDNSGVDYDLTDNIRRDLFGGRGGFINTEEGKPFIAGIASSEDLDEKYVDAYPFPYTIVHKRKEKTQTAEDLRMTTGYLLYDLITTANLSSGGGENSQALKFYIKTEGEKFYVGEYNKNLEDALPYGIRVPETQNYYPLEKVNIHLAFPEFYKWIKNESFLETTIRSGKEVIIFWNDVLKTSKENCFALDSSGMWRF